MKKLPFFLLSFAALCSSLFGEISSAQDQYSFGMEAYKAQEWKHVIDRFWDLLEKYPSTPFSVDAEYYMGVAYFHLGDFEMANEYFSDYLERPTKLKFFEDALRWKFNIAEQYRAGVRFPLIRAKYIPRLLPANEEALDIYDEIISALSNHDLAARSLYGKAKVLAKIKDFSESTDTFEQLIRRFPKHSLCPDAYFAVGKNYLSQIEAEFVDRDLLQMAEINLQKFAADFPASPLIADAKITYHQMEEVYAEALFEVGDFYERTKRFGAAKIYYTKILQRYPTSQVAGRVTKRMEKVNAKLEQKKKEAPAAVS